MEPQAVAADNHYLINAAGKYEFFLDGESLFETDEVAFLFDVSCNTLLKHGKPAMVEEVHRIMAGAYASHGIQDIADDLVVMRGKFPLEEINKIVNICDRIGKFYRDNLGRVRQEQASLAFQDYDFGSGVSATDTEGWVTTSPDDGDWTRIVYVNFEDGSSDRVSFHVRFRPNQVTPDEVYGLLMSNGAEIGHLPTPASAPHHHAAP